MTGFNFLDVGRENSLFLPILFLDFGKSFEACSLLQATKFDS